MPVLSGQLCSMTPLMLVVMMLLIPEVNGREAHIIGGTTAQQGEFPSMGMLLLDGNFACGCILLASKTVLTAWHCVKPYDVSRLRVRFGRYKLQEQSAHEKEVQVQNKFGRTDLEGSDTVYADVAVLELAEEIMENGDHIQYTEPWCGDYPVGQDARVAGWGRVDVSSNQLANELKKVTIRRVADDNCNLGLYEDEVCFGNDEAAGERDNTCNGDSGGGLYAGTQNDDAAAGVVSAGPIGCDVDNPHTVYIDVSYYCTWIKNARTDIQKPALLPDCGKAGGLCKARCRNGFTLSSSHTCSDSAKKCCLPTNGNRRCKFAGRAINKSDGKCRVKCSAAVVPLPPGVECEPNKKGKPRVCCSA